MHIQDVIIGKTLASFLKETDTPKGELAKHLEVSQALITGILKGTTRLSLTRLLDICKYLDISPIKFLNRMDKAKVSSNIQIEV